LSLAPIATGESFSAKYSQGLSPVRLLPSIIHFEKVRGIRTNEKRASELHGRQQIGSRGGVEESKDSQDVTQDIVIETNCGGYPEDNRSCTDDEDVSMRYLASVVQQGCRSSAVWNYLVSLYIRLENEDPLYDFLASNIPDAPVPSDAKSILLANMHDNDSYSIPLDLSFAMRAVLGSGRHFRSAIKLYMGLGMRQQAVELALKVDPALARKIAQDSVELDERKRLWLMIAKTAATSSSDGEGKDVVSRVVSVLRDCGPEVLSIEDVLVFL
jgi:vacuolar protein sorting-associated protein 18